MDEAKEQIPGCRALVDVKVVDRVFSTGYEIEGECLIGPAIAAGESE